MKKILVSDFDGTFYKSDEETFKNVELVNRFRDKGNIFVIATGRPFADIKSKLEYFSIKFDYLVLCNGSLILDKEFNILRKTIIDKESAREAIKYLNSSKEIRKINIYGTFNKNIDSNSDDITYILMTVDNKELAVRMANYINNNFCNIKSYNTLNEPGISLFDMIPDSVDKAEAVEFVIKLENVYNIYAIGDSSNDIEMIKKYNGYGMTNSDDKVIEVASKLYDNVYDLIEEVI